MPIKPTEDESGINYNGCARILVRRKACIWTSFYILKSITIVLQVTKQLSNTPVQAHDTMEMKQMAEKTKHSLKACPCNQEHGSELPLSYSSTISCKPGLSSASTSAQGPHYPYTNAYFCKSFPHIVQKSPMEGDWELGFHLLPSSANTKAALQRGTHNHRCDQLNRICQPCIGRGTEVKKVQKSRKHHRAPHSLTLRFPASRKYKILWKWPFIAYGMLFNVQCAVEIFRPTLKRFFEVVNKQRLLHSMFYKEILFHLFSFKLKTVS